MPISTIGSNSLNQTSDLTINGQTVGKGGGNVSTNTVHGVSALNGNSSGTGVTAIGSSALPVSTASNNTAVGRVSGNSTTSGSDNTFLGMQSGYTNVTGSSNVYVGVSAGYTATGSSNTLVGQGSGGLISSGGKNTIIGRYDGNQGGLDIRTASNNIVLSDGDGNPRGLFDGSGNFLVNQTAMNGAEKVGISYDRAGSWGMQIRNTTGTTSPTTYIAFKYVNTQTGYIESSNGSSTTYATSSDYRLKESVTPITNALDKVSALKPVNWKWKSTGTDGQGFIAHELAEVVPDCVSGDKDAVDADGNPVYQGVDTSFLVATLTAAIQELKTIVDAQAAEIAELKAKVA